MEQGSCLSRVGGMQMVLRKKDYPEIGEYVIATAVELKDHGVYVNLDEFDKNGYIPIGEIASTWVKNIKDFVKEGQKVVLKVIRMDDKKGHIDLSLRKVTEREKKDKLIQWKKSNKAEKLLEGAAKSLDKDYSEAVKSVGVPLEDYFGDLYTALEAVSSKGPEALKPAGVAEVWAKAVYEAAKDHIETPSVQVNGIIRLNSIKPRGVEDIKRALLEGKKVTPKSGGRMEITSLGAPRYRIVVTAKDYKIAEEIMKETADTIISKITSAGGSGSFAR
jgi:translation initiation factor 2 subunit 1